MLQAVERLLFFLWEKTNLGLFFQLDLLAPEIICVITLPQGPTQENVFIKGGLGRQYPISWR